MGRNLLLKASSNESVTISGLKQECEIKVAQAGRPAYYCRTLGTDKMNQTENLEVLIII